MLISKAELQLENFPPAGSLTLQTAAIAGAGPIQSQGLLLHLLCECREPSTATIFHLFQAH